MSKTLSTLLFLAILYTLLQGSFLLAIPLILYFTYHHSALWLVGIAVLVDGYFGAFFATPVFTILMILWYAISEFIKPKLLWHNTSDYA